MLVCWSPEARGPQVSPLQGWGRPGVQGMRPDPQQGLSFAGAPRDSAAVQPAPSSAGTGPHSQMFTAERGMQRQATGVPSSCPTATRGHPNPPCNHARTQGPTWLCGTGSP